MNQAPIAMRDHWWWRPGWSVGRSFYTWHFTFERHPDLLRVAHYYRRALQDLAQLDPVPEEWLHLTTQGIGFTNEVTPDEITRIVAASVSLLGDESSFRAILGPVRLDPEGVFLPVEPITDLTRIRRSLRAAISGVIGQGRLAEDDTFRPHVTIAYSNTTGDSGPIDDVISSVRPQVATPVIDSISLIEINRDNKQYQWTEIAAVALGADLRH